jgi:hypothetical protein
MSQGNLEVVRESRAALPTSSPRPQVSKTLGVAELEGGLDVALRDRVGERTNAGDAFIPHRAKASPASRSAEAPACHERRHLLHLGALQGEHLEHLRGIPALLRIPPVGGVRELRACCLAQVGGIEDFRFGPECSVFKVGAYHARAAGDLRRS